MTDETATQTPARNGRGKANDPSIDASSEGKKSRKERPMRSLAGMAEASAMGIAEMKRKVDNVQSEWKNLPNFCLFSLSADGSYPCVKSSKSSYIDLVRERQENDIFSGRCYRLY